MADCYPAQITIRGVREADLSRSDKERFEAGEWNERGELTALGEALTAIREVAQQRADEVTEYPGDDGPRLRLELWEARWGASEIRDWGLPAKLRAAGLAYKLHDEPHYEWDGEHEDWVPGMDSPRLRSGDSAGDVTLKSRDWKKMKERANTPEELCELVDEWFTELL